MTRTHIAAHQSAKWVLLRKNPVVTHMRMGMFNNQPKASILPGHCQSDWEICYIRVLNKRCSTHLSKPKI